MMGTLAELDAMQPTHALGLLLALVAAALYGTGRFTRAVGRQENNSLPVVRVENGNLKAAVYKGTKKVHHHHHHQHHQLCSVLMT